MNKLELKHLAPYLPYEVKVDYKDDESDEYPILSASNRDVSWVISPISVLRVGAKLFLRPLSDLNKEGFALVRGEFSDWNIEQISNNIFLKQIPIYSLPYHLCETLFKNQFDVFGLIENDLAIDINTLK